MCYFWRDGVGWSPEMATVVSQVGQGHHYVDYGGRIFKQSAQQLSHVTERERLAREAVRESQDPGQNVDHVSDEETELPQQPSQTSGQENNVALVSPPDVPMPDPVLPETPNANAETSNDDRENTAEPVPHSSSSHSEWRPEYEVPPPEPDDSAVTRRRVVAKRPSTVGEEEEMRQKRLTSEPVPELFPLTGEELSENVFEIVIDLFESRGSEHCEDSHVSAGSEHCEDSRVPEAHVYTQDRDRFRPLQRRVEVSMRDLSREDREAFNRAKQKEWTAWLDKEAVELVKDRLNVPRSHILRGRCVLTWNNVGTEKVPKDRLCSLGFQDPRLTTLPTSSPTLTSDGESAILQSIVNEGHLLESGDLKTAFLSGDPDPTHKGSDALCLKTLVEIGTRRCVEIANLRQAGFVSLQMDPCVWILPASSPVEHVSLVDVPTKFKKDVADSSVSPVPETHMDRWKRQRNVLGVLGVHVDDLVGGGNLVFQKAVQWLRTELEFGTWEQSRFRFRGRELCQHYNRKSIKISMSKFVQEMEPVAVPKHVEDDLDAPLEANVHSISWRCWSAAMAAVARKSTPGFCHRNLAEQICDSQRS